MAKLTGPLFSLAASGKLAKSLVYMKWKGIDDVRKYVIPANPRSDDQMTQRGYFEDAVDEWHGAGYTAVDNTAWNLFATTMAKVMSGFNSMIKLFVDAAIIANIWTRISDGKADTITSTSMMTRVKKAAGDAPYVNWGTKKTVMANTHIMVFDTGTDWHYQIPDLEPETDYYLYFTFGAPLGGTYGRTGIYKYKTLAA